MKNKKESVLITGGAGYLGSILTSHLLNKGYRVTCLDNLMYRQDSPFFFSHNENYSFSYGDVREKVKVKELVANNDIILPLAAIVGAPACKECPQEVVSTNYEAVKMINKLRSKDQILIFPTTNSGYGTTTGDEFCTEETPLIPVSLYGRTKADAEKCILDSNKGGITFRLATIFGTSPRMRADLLVNDFVYKAVSDGYLVIFQGHFKRNYLHIRDMARAFQYSIENYSSMKNEIYNIGLDSANMSKLELAERIKRFVPNFNIIPSEIGEDPDKRNYIVSSAKILKHGFKPIHSLDEGIQELIRGYNILIAIEHREHGNF